MKYLFSILMITCLPTRAMFEYRPANESDISGVLSLMNSEAVNETTKLVVLPKQFRESFVRRAFDKNRLFVATKNSEIVSYKELFLVSDATEKDNFLKKELRCEGSESQCVFRGLVDQRGAVVASQDAFVQPALNSYETCIYDGLDFTKNEFRGFGINRALTNISLDTITSQVQNAIRETGSKSVTFLYGLTCANAGEQPGKFPDRTMSIAKSFQRFVQKLEGSSNPVVLEHSRYKAFMPTFDQNSHDCNPLPDEKAVPGFGCELTYRLKEHYV